ncbi:MAG: iron chelate uptake ABC transporter family permease subunit [Nitrospinae bacterium]|nr:iron chelate uptake ABC transporter family permease subunit [Nitrospinota bacterium]
MNPPAISARLCAVALVGALLMVGMLALTVGSVSVPFGQIVSLLLHQLHLAEGGSWTSTQAAVIVQVRLPRILMACLVGGGLALSGAVMQGIFHNPMADPGLLGVSSGAALGAVLALHLGLAAQYYLLLPGLAFFGALLAAMTVYGLATAGGRTPIATLLLSGIAISSLSVALTSFILSTSREAVLREILFWLMGGLEASTWEHVRLSAPVVLLGAGVTLLYARDLDILLWGEERALALGVDTQRCRHILLAVATAMTAVVVSFSGTVGFVGLVVPHMLRLLVGPNHQRLLPASFLGGAVFLILADLMARTLLRPQELRLGVLTAFVGVPFFLYLLRANRRRLEPL